MFKRRKARARVGLGVLGEEVTALTLGRENEGLGSVPGRGGVPEVTLTDTPVRGLADLGTARVRTACAPEEGACAEEDASVSARMVPRSPTLSPEASTEADFGDRVLLLVRQQRMKGFSCHYASQ